MLDIKDIVTDIRKSKEALQDGFKRGIVNPHHLPQIATIFEEVGTLKEDGSYLIAAMLLNNLDANLRKLPPDIRYLDEALKGDIGKLVKEVSEALLNGIRKRLSGVQVSPDTPQREIPRMPRNGAKGKTVHWARHLSGIWDIVSSQTVHFGWIKLGKYKSK